MDTNELIQKAKKNPTPETLRALAEAIPGSVKEIKLKKKNQSAFSINQSAIDAWKKKNQSAMRKETILTKDR